MTGVANERPVGKNTTPRLGISSTIVKQVLDAGQQAFDLWLKQSSRHRTRSAVRSTKEEFKALVVWIQECMALVLAYQFLLRTTSTRNLKGKNVWVEANEVILKVEAKWERGTNDKLKLFRLPLTNPVAKFLATLIKHQLIKKNDEEVLFPEAVPHSSANLVQLMEKVFKRLKIKLPKADGLFKYDWHCLRRGGATACMRLKVDTLQIQTLGGWNYESAMLKYLDEHQKLGTHDNYFFGHMLGENSVQI